MIAAPGPLLRGPEHCPAEKRPAAALQPWGKPVVHTASFYQPQHWVGAPFRVSRLHPRGLKAQWKTLPFFYPSAEVIKTYRSGQMDFQSLASSYLATLEERWATDAVVKRWIDEAPGLGDFTLLCFEWEGDPCHSRVLARWLKGKASGLVLGSLR